MGYSTEFKGAFKITPALDTRLACRLNLWLNSRHFRRKPLLRGLPDKSMDMSDITLFGKPGPDGEFYMPSLREAFKQLTDKGYNPAAAPWMLQDNNDIPLLESKDDVLAYSTTPGNMPSLYSDFVLVPAKDCTYLGWDTSEKAQHMDKWGYALHGLLTSIGYVVSGVISAQGENPDDQWQMISDEAGFYVQVGYVLPYTWEAEFQKAWDKSSAAAKSEKADTAEVEQLVLLPETLTPQTTGLFSPLEETET